MTPTALQEWLAWLGSTRPRLRWSDAAYRRCRPAWRVGPRTLDEHFMLCADQGRIDGEVDGEAISVQAGSFLWIAPGVPHRLSVAVPGRRLVMHHMRWHLEPGRSVPMPRCIQVAEADGLRSTLAALVNESVLGGDLQDDRQRALLAILVVDAARAGDADRGGLTPARREMVLRLVREKPGWRFSRGDLARACGLSPVHFSRCFQRSFGCPPRIWLARERLREAAARLAASDAQVGAIAAELGWSDVHLFSRQFRQRFGVPPTRWRRTRGA